MATFDNDEMDEDFDNGNGDLNNGAAGGGSNRNFFLALGILGGLFLVITIVLVLLWLNNRQPVDTERANINATNQAILTANAQTAMAATLESAFRLTPSSTPSATLTPVPPTATATPLLAQAATTTSLPDQAVAVLMTASALGTPELEVAGQLTAVALGTPDIEIAAKLTVLAQETPDVDVAGQFTATISAPTSTLSISGMLTEAVRQTVTSQAALNLTRTATTLPKSGFADEVGLPGLFGMALGLVLVILLVRRLRFSGQ
jgi:preprotein translocase subunit SecG